MRKELLKSKSGTEFYSFIYYNSADQRRIRLGRDYIRARFGKDISDEQEADQILEILGKELNSLAKVKDERLTLSEEEYEFSNLLEIYAVEQKKAAPNSYKNNIHYLKYYVLYYFLRIKECKELESWHIYYEDFKEWLESSAYLVKKPDQLISYASKNHTIRALNTFMRHMQRKRHIFSLHICKQFPEHFMKEKSVDEVVTVEEMTKIVEAFKDSEYGLLYKLLFYTGMRFNEARGLSLENIYPGKIENTTIEKRLKEHKMKYYGYLVFNSQPLNRKRLREDNGHIKRKPLKGRKKIDEKSSRIVPITDKVLWKALVKAHNRVLKEYEKRIYGDNRGNYVIFEKVNSTSTTELRRLSYDLGIAYRTWHSLRHTRATYLVGETGDFFLARL